MHLVALLEQQLGEVGAVLAGDAGDQRALVAHSRGSARDSSSSAASSCVGRLNAAARLGAPLLSVAEPLFDEGEALREHLRLVRQPRDGEREVQQQYQDEAERHQEERVRG